MAKKQLEEMAKAKKVRKTRIEAHLDQEDIKDLIKSDDKMKQYRRIVKAISEDVKLEKLEIELMSLHAGRSSRRLYGKNPGVESLSNAALQDSANRSRISEIRVEIYKQIGILEEANKAIKKHILQEHAAHAAGFKTKGERMAFAENHITRGMKLTSQLENFMARCDFIIKDIDQTGFAINRGVECLEILYSSGNNKKHV